MSEVRLPGRENDTLRATRLFTRLLDYTDTIEQVGTQVRTREYIETPYKEHGIIDKQELLRRVGGANYQIPFPVQGHRQLHYAFSWLVQSARARSGMPYEKRLALEIVDAYNETGAAFKKKEDTHKMAEANRAFAHFARG